MNRRGVRKNENECSASMALLVTPVLSLRAKKHETAIKKDAASRKARVHEMPSDAIGKISWSRRNAGEVGKKGHILNYPYLVKSYPFRGTLRPSKLDDVFTSIVAGCVRTRTARRFEYDL